MNYKHTNALINSTSPYLLQHAHNPVNWQQWSNELIESAKKDGKLLLVSIGYAACHWCHVMEHESFEDEEVAKIMNDNFVCIKIDREERPDVDQYYMTAVQLMQQRGGWPLNIIALPDGRPIWGGTYFPKDNWVKNIKAVAGLYKENVSKVEEYAISLQKGIQQVSLTTESENIIPANIQLLERGVETWKNSFDMKDGGNTGAPKFPMPVNLEFLLYYGFMKRDNKTLKYVETTLEKMAQGGIYDQAGGGFARYSVDGKWKVPHFEKMLYDNGQLISIYAKGFQYFKNEEFKNVVYETITFLERELMDSKGAFYSSLDADSEGIEGKFYVWSRDDLKQIITEDFDLFSKYFNINAKGYWEHENYILLRTELDTEFAKKNNLIPVQLEKKVLCWKRSLMKERSKRIRPGLDDKTLTSWNALVISGLVDAYKVFQDDHFLNLALTNALFLKENIMLTNGEIFHNWKNGKSSIDGFLEDYSLLCQAFISLFEVTGDEEWINLAGKLSAYVFLHFYNEESGLFYFSENNNKSPITNHYQKEDNVIPSSNSVMANNLHKLYLLLGNSTYLNIVRKMLHHITPHFTKYPMAYANWGNLVLKIEEPYFEMVITGNRSKEYFKEMLNEFHPNVLWAIAEKETKISLLRDRYVDNETLIYVCEKGTCQLPVKSVPDAMEILNNEY